MRETYEHRIPPTTILLNITFTNNFREEKEAKSFQSKLAECNIFYFTPILAKVGTSELQF